MKILWSPYKVTACSARTHAGHVETRLDATSGGQHPCIDTIVEGHGRDDGVRHFGPYREDTQAVVMAAERGYDEIVDIVREQELKREKPEPEQDIRRR